MFKLIREETSADDVPAQRHQWAVKFTALYTVDDTSAKVFVMHASPDTDVFADSLSCVANAIQMTDLPEDEPLSGSPFYRVDSVTKLCRSAEAAEEFVEKIKYAVQDLADNLYSASVLSVVEEVTITPTNT